MMHDKRPDPDCRDLIEAARAASTTPEETIAASTEALRALIRATMPVWRPTLENRPRHR
jgi:hypothetical protein